MSEKKRTAPPSFQLPAEKRAKINLSIEKAIRDALHTPEVENALVASMAPAITNIVTTALASDSATVVEHQLNLFVKALAGLDGAQLLARVSGVETE